MDLTLPPFLKRFDLKKLGTEGSTLVAIDAHYVIQWFNDAWQRFALENHGELALATFGTGSSYLNGISGVLRDFYRTVFDNALLTGEVFGLEYECSSPTVYRRCHMRAFPFASQGLLLAHSSLIEEPIHRAESPPLEERYRLPSGVIVQCANCRRVRRNEEPSWDWIPSWVEKPPRGTSHGICAVCRGFYWGSPSSERRKEGLSA